MNKLQRSEEKYNANVTHEGEVVDAFTFGATPRHCDEDDEREDLMKYTFSIETLIKTKCASSTGNNF